MNGAPDRRSIAVAATLIGLAVAARLVSLHALHPLNWDEIEFFRATDWVRQGLVPYRDFWEHHTPLQWFLFAPITAFLTSPGVSTIIAMRWAQLPLWIATFALVNVWMRDAGIPRFARWAAMAVPLSSTVFMLPAVEYRVDVVGIALLVTGLVLLQRMDRGVGYALAAGAAFALGGFANLRIGPALVLLMLLARITRLRERRWAGEPRANFVFAGAAAATALCLVYFVATHALADFYRHVWSENFLADRLAANVPWMFWQRVVTPFGFRFGPPFGATFAWSAIDVGGILLIGGGTLALFRILVERFRAPDAAFFISAATLVNALFISAMKFVFNYHLEVICVLAVPLIAFEIERIGRRRAVIAALIVATALNVIVAVFRGKEGDLGYQDTIMREVDRRTPPGSAVFDGAGWALHRRPAYRYWFLRNIVTVLEQHGDFEPYTPQELIARPPAAIVADHDARLWFGRRVVLGRVAASHYLPTWRDLWLPGLSARLDPGATAAWIAPADGDYRVVASPRLAAHPWFRQPFDFNRWMWRSPSVALTPADVSGDVAFTVDGAPAAGSILHLRKGARVTAFNRGALPLGVMLVRGDPRELFRQPPVGITLEAAATPQWHVPALR